MTNSLQIGSSEPLGPLGNPGNLGPLGNLGSEELALQGNGDRFNLDDIDYFNLFYEGKLLDIVAIIEHINKSTFFRDIYIFLNRVKNIARAKDNELLR